MLKKVGRDETCKFGAEARNGDVDFGHRGGKEEEIGEKLERKQIYENEQLLPFHHFLYRISCYIVYLHCREGADCADIPLYTRLFLRHESLSKTPTTT